jgi:hypothetical protein
MKDHRNDRNAPSRPPEWIGDGRSRETAVFFTNARTQLEHIHMQHEFVESRGIVGVRGSVGGEEGFIYDVWSTPGGGQLWFKVPVSPDEEFMEEIKRAIKMRQSSYAEFEARLQKLFADDPGQKEEICGETTVPWNGELRERILSGIRWGIQKADLRAIYKGLLCESAPYIMQDLEMPIHGHLAAAGFFFAGQGLHMVAASLHFEVQEKRLSEKDVLLKSNRILAGLKELYGEPWIAVPWNGRTFDYMWRSQETLLQFAWDGRGGWGVHYRSMKLDEFVRHLEDPLANEMPRWAWYLLEHMRPTPEQIVRLEDLRLRIGEGHEAFYRYIGGHPRTTRKVQYQLYDHLRAQNPRATEEEILELLVFNRHSAALLNGINLFGLAKDEDEVFVRRLKEIVAGQTLDTLIEMFVREDAKNGASSNLPKGRNITLGPDLEWAAAEVDRILGAPHQSSWK